MNAALKGEAETLERLDPLCRALRTTVMEYVRGCRGLYLPEGVTLGALLLEEERAEGLSQEAQKFSQFLGEMRSLLENALFDATAKKRMFHFRLEGLKSKRGRKTRGGL